MITAKTAAETLREIGAALASGRATLIAALFADDCIGATFSPSLGTCVPPPALGRSRSAWEPQRWVLFRRRLFAADRRWRLRLCQYADIERFGLEDAPVRDGRVKQADLIELATGHEGQASAARRILGDDVGDPTDPVWGFDEEGEMRGMWRPTGQKRLWFLAGGLAQCRGSSKMLALQIKARELGICMIEVGAPLGSLPAVPDAGRSICLQRDARQSCYSPVHCRVT